MFAQDQEINTIWVFFCVLFCASCMFRVMIHVLVTLRLQFQQIPTAAAAGGKDLLCFTFCYIFKILISIGLLNFCKNENLMMYSMDLSQVAIINSMVLF